VRRWFKFGADQGIQAFADEGLDTSVFVSMQHKAQTLKILQKCYGNGSQIEAIYVQCAYFNPGFVAPDPACNANHLPPGYSMIGGFSPLGVFLFNGFVDRNFHGTPAPYIMSLTPPSEDGG